MIKVELLKQENGITTITFQSNKPEDKDEMDKLDELLLCLVSPLPKRGGFIAGSPGVLKVDINTK
jgi:hypothetical protein